MILFVLDVSPEIGFGHLIRCMNLARLNKCSMQPLFLIKENKAACAMLQAKKIPFFTSLERVFEGIKPKLAILDIAHITNEHLKVVEKLKSNDIPCVQITDLGLNILPKVTLVDGSFFAYGNQTQKIFNGPDYMILHHKIRHFHKLNRHYRKHINQIFLSLGGGASHRHLRTFIDFFHRHHFKCKISPGFSLKKNQKKIMSRLYPSIHWVGQTESVARALFECDLAVITPGITAYEAAATGTPALYFSHHSLQEKTADHMMTNNIGINMGQINDFLPKTLLEKVQLLSHDDRESMGKNGKRSIDGLGLYRVYKIIQSVDLSSGNMGVSL